jgi:hypothetical protein
MTTKDNKSESTGDFQQDKYVERAIDQTNAFFKAGIKLLEDANINRDSGEFGKLLLAYTNHCHDDYRDSVSCYFQAKFKN